jgi:Trk K+ transport system NAD-binding subunit
MIGCSVAIGAFLAGVSLASLSYNLEIISMVKSLRDFFATIFFVSLGMQITLAATMLVAPIIMFSLLVVVGGPLIVMVLMSLSGYSKKVSFLSGIAIAQISEFSLIIIALGRSLGHIPKEIVSLTAIIAVVTITISTYLIQYNNQLYLRFSRFLSVFERLSKKVKHLEYRPAAFKADVVLCGYNRVGYSILKKLQAMKKSLLIVDYNPELIKQLAKEGVPCVYGDIGDLEILNRLDLANIEILISTVPDASDNLLLIKKTKEVNKKAVVIVTANQIDEALRLYDAGADYVVLPHFLGGEHVSILLEDFTKDFNKILETRLSHIRELSHRKTLGHEHPAHA